MAVDTTLAPRDVSPTEYGTRTVTVDFLFLDRVDCDRCRETEESLETAIERVRPLFEEIGATIDYRRIHVDSIDAAKQTELDVSPTIRIDGRDVQPEFASSSCESCTDIAEGETVVDCRDWVYRGETYEVAPVPLLIEALLRGAVGPSSSSETSGSHFQLSEEMRSFFEGDSDDSDCGCGC